ncbi:hypothetical protein [Variovorax sp.]|uniref:hypothetical protein n=1 Tax=Variovorax sp. TaxID=1871043 RepID=UPI003BAA83F3
MKERPILFSAPMVRALLDGTKTQTRRVVKPQPDSISPDGIPARFFHQRAIGSGYPVQIRSPYGQLGDRLWVRETWQAVRGDDRARHICTSPRPDVGWIEYAATPREDEPAYKWRPSIHMPRWASRIDLEVTGVRIERLQDISEADARAEGYDIGPPPCIDDPVRWYRYLWEQLNGAGSWDANPWVWVVMFRRARP